MAYVFQFDSSGSDTALGLILARRAPANAPGVPFDFSQGGVQRGMWPAMHVCHGFEGMAFRVDRELTGGVLPDVPHRTTEEVCKMPDCASVCRNDNYIHIEPPWPDARSLQKL